MAHGAYAYTYTYAHTYIHIYIYISSYITVFMYVYYTYTHMWVLWTIIGLASALLMFPERAPEEASTGL